MSRIPYGIMPYSFGAESEEERRRRLAEEETPEPGDQRGAAKGGTRQTLPGGIEGDYVPGHAKGGEPGINDPGYAAYWEQKHQELLGPGQAAMQRRREEEGMLPHGMNPDARPSDDPGWGPFNRPFDGMFQGRPEAQGLPRNRAPEFLGDGALQPRPLIPQEAVQFTEGDRQALQRLQNSQNQVQQWFGESEIDEATAAHMNGQLVEKMQPLLQRQQKFQEQQKQQALQSQMEEMATATGMQMQNMSARAKAFPSTVMAHVNPMTGATSHFIQQPDGTIEQIKEPSGGGEGQAAGEGLDFFPHPAQQMQVAQAGQYGDNPPGPLAPPGPEEAIPEPGQAGEAGVQGPPAPTEQTYGTPADPDAPAPKQPSGRVMSIGTPEYGTAAHQRQVQQAAKYQQLMQGGWDAKQAKLAVYQPEKFQLAQQAKRAGLDGGVVTGIEDGLLTSNDIRTAQRLAEQAVPAPTRTGNPRIDIPAQNDVRRRRMDIMEKNLGWTVQNRMARRAESGRAEAETQRQDNRKEVIGIREQIRKDAAENKAGWDVELEHLRQTGKIDQLTYDHELKLGRMAADKAAKKQADEESAKLDREDYAEARRNLSGRKDANGNPLPVTHDEIAKEAANIRGYRESRRNERSVKPVAGMGSAIADAMQGVQDQPAAPPLSDLEAEARRRGLIK